MHLSAFGLNCLKETRETGSRWQPGGQPENLKANG
jgi:hypothetical protein